MMRRLALSLFALLGIAACTNDQTNPGGTSPGAPAGQEAAAPAGQEAAAPSDPKGRTPFIFCLDLIREKRFEEALTACQEAEKTNPGDPQILKAIEMAKENTGG